LVWAADFLGMGRRVMTGMRMHSSYLKLKPACPLKKVKPGPTRARGLGSRFVSRIIGSSAHGPAMDMIPAFNCMACARPLDWVVLNPAATDPEPGRRG